MDPHQHRRLWPTITSRIEDVLVHNEVEKEAVLGGAGVWGEVVEVDSGREGGGVEGKACCVVCDES